MAVLYALLCLVFAAFNDFLFKLYARKDRSRGMFVSLVGIAWFCVSVWFPWSGESSMRETVAWGLISGAFSVFGNILLIESMSHQSAGVCSTIYRLNMVFVVIGAALFFGETLSVLKWCGVILAVAAVAGFMPSRRELKVRGIGFLLVMAACVSRACMGLSYKYAFLHGADRNGVVMIDCLMWIVCGFGYAFLRERPVERPDRKLLGYGLVSGLLVSGIVIFMALSLQKGDASIVIPIAQMSFLGTFALGMLFLKERLTPAKGLGILFGTGAILLLAL